MYPRAYGKYVLLEHLAVGGMSEIDLARLRDEDGSFARFVAIKRIKSDKADEPHTIRMFLDETRITAELEHANIAQVYGSGRTQDEYYIALEYVPGIDVRMLVNEVRDRGHFIPMRVILRIVCDVLAGLHYAHQLCDSSGQPMKIVHRDVNPRNIMVSVRGDVKLIDFGVAKAADRLERTRTDHVKGKFSYMAPEHMSGQDVDGRADLFSAALTLHEMVSGKGLFSGLTHLQVMHRMMAGALADTPSHPDLPDPTPLRVVQRRALAFERVDRFRDCDAYRRALEEVAKPLGGLATTTEVAEYIQRTDPSLSERLSAMVERHSDLGVAWSFEPLPPDEEVELLREPVTESMPKRSLLLPGILATVGAILLGTAVAVAIVAVVWWMQVN